MTDVAGPGAASGRKKPPSPGQGFSAVLRELAEGEGDRVSVAAILAAFGDRAFGALLLIFALPNALPMPPGTSAILGAPLVFIAFQLMIGRPVLWLPRFITERSMTRENFRALANKVEPWVGRLERLLKPRAQILTTPVADRLTGAACFVLALVLFLPIPFGNMPPAAAISAFALGIIEKDGLAIAAGWLGVVLSGGILAALWKVSAAAIHALAAPVLRLFGG